MKINKTKLTPCVTVLILVFLFGISDLLFGQQESLTGGPYMQNPNIATATSPPDPRLLSVVWFTDQDPPPTLTCKIEYRVVGSPTWTCVQCAGNAAVKRRVSPSSIPPLTTQYDLTINGLTSGSVYEYRLWGNGANNLLDTCLSPGCTFKPMKDATSHFFRFFALGDSGQDPASKPPDNQQNVANAVFNTNPDLGIHVGDIVYPGHDSQGNLLWTSGSYKGYSPMYLSPYRSIIKRMIFWTSLGNHESDFWAPYKCTGIPSCNPSECPEGCPPYAPYLDIFYLPANGPDPAGAFDPNINVRNYFFDYANARFIVIDTNAAPTADWTNKITPWLRDTALNTTKPWKFVFFHHPAYSSGEHGCDQPQYRTPIRNLVNNVMNGRVDIVFTGHDHDYEYIPERNGTTKPFFIVTGAGGNSLGNSVVKISEKNFGQ